MKPMMTESGKHGDLFATLLRIEGDKSHERFEITALKRTICWMVSNTRLSVLISLYVSVDAETDIHGSVKIFNKFP